MTTVLMDKCMAQADAAARFTGCLLCSDWSWGSALLHPSKGRGGAALSI
jgi:hypothetical protein